ncbi:efflux RND transporter periplasmic adaptor subunit [Clostridium aminobutyricum]|uniref:Efflux RND transporter periplasmic adaptor subunit n=1 Tax=Clostridium aminobutyricum TaxID=33953 RepID=A0A939IIY3_CLOAM|nr:efflux RND transporter periplasmic adaptor subunit [Clostridium aminobutyricum]MBN7773546.1 efflux RND transporter periplasmic adaptor subunit [Clostridium aminobutyricum]
MKEKKLDLKQLMKQKTILIAVAVLMVVSLTGVRIFSAQKVPKEELSLDNSIAVETAEVSYTDSIGGLTYKANLEPAEEATVSSNVSGQVTQVLFENGDKVEQGQALATLDDKDLQNQMKTAKVDLSKLQLELDAAKSDADIAGQLYAGGACSKTSYDTAMRAYKTVLANVELKKIELQDILNSLNDCIIKSPVTGEASGKNITVGQYLNQGTVIASVKNNTSIKAEIQLLQNDLEKVAVGQEVTLKLSHDDTMTYKGFVETIATSANSQTRAFDCLIKIDNTAGALKSGVFGTIEISDKENQKTLAAPMSAVAGSEGNYSAFTIENGLARKVPVEIGVVSNDMVEITSGLKEGDRIITSNLNSLQDGDKVSVAHEKKALRAVYAPTDGEGE